MCSCLLRLKTPCDPRSHVVGSQTLGGCSERALRCGVGVRENWRKIRDLAKERLTDLDEREQATLAREIEAARNLIEDWILNRWQGRGGKWSQSDADAARDFIRSAYPWMDKRNVAHAISQGTYYAWHG